MRLQNGIIGCVFALHIAEAIVINLKTMARNTIALVLLYILQVSNVHHFDANVHHYAFFLFISLSRLVCIVVALATQTSAQALVYLYVYASE